MSGGSPSGRWSAPVIALHWSAGALMLALIVLGGVMVYAPLGAAAKFDLYQWHKSFGFLALALTAAHLVARLAATAPPERSRNRRERWLAGAAQGTLYALGFAAILAGWLLVSASPLPIPTRFFGGYVIPDIASPDAALFAAATRAHKWAAWAIAAIAALHIAGALKHHLIDRDDVLTRMLPRLRRASPRPRRSPSVPRAAGRAKPP